MKVIISGILLILAITVTAQEKGSFFKNQCIKINDSIYVEKNLITNVQYRLMLKDMKRVYGEHSKEYISMLPKFIFEKDPKHMRYFYNRKFRNYPMLGLTKEQADSFGSFKFGILMLYTSTKNKWKLKGGGTPVTLHKKYPVRDLFWEIPNVKDVERSKFYRVTNTRIPSEKEYEQLTELMKNETPNKNVATRISLNAIMSDAYKSFAGVGCITELTLNDTYVDGKLENEIQNAPNENLWGCRVVYVFAPKNKPSDE